ncbi:MAG TPA: efflux RND transporter periplasmic adaptor subunit [Chthoniobacteraceae bacterium]|jgi:HlyD family secretion protein|nr:efflux RND transporter periplasmic adaptor subunit [Chthoniobacteraceae bacterium]
MKPILVILIAVFSAGGGWWYWQAAHEDPVKYQTGVVMRGDVTQVVTATGQLNPVLNVQVGSQISGNILKLYADYNSPVKENEIVAVLDPAPYTAAVHQADANVAFAQAALELAQLTAKRKAELVKEHAAPQADLDTAVANLHQALATLQINQAALETAQVNLDHCTITSPIDGIVISRSVDVGETVAASLNAPVLFTIANDLRKMQIDASIAEGDVGEVDNGQAVNFTVDAYPYRTFHGVVAQVRNSPVTVQNVVTYDTVVSVNNADLKLKPGMTASISVVIAQHNNVLEIPNAALRFRPPEDAKKLVPYVPGTPPPRRSATPAQHIRHDGAHTIYVLPPDAKKPEPVQVHLGISDGIYTEVLDGLKDGDVVVDAILSDNPALEPQNHGPGRRPF